MSNQPRPERQTLLQAVRDALTDVVAEDHLLLTLEAHELALVHRFGVYLEERLRGHLQDHGLSVDLDYDRHGHLQKFLPERPDRDGDKRFRPDLIVHRRTDDAHNLLVVEWKKRSSHSMLDLLCVRLESLLVADADYHDYRYDLGVIVDSNDSGVRWRAYDRGGPVDRWRDIRIRLT